MSKKYIRVDNPRPHLALQAFAVAIEQAVKEGYTISGDPTHHARELNVGQYDITLVMTDAEAHARAGIMPFSAAASNNEEANFLANFVRVGNPAPQPVTLTSTANPEDAPAIVTFPEKEVYNENPYMSLNSGNPLLTHLEACKTKQDLLDFAARHAIVVPEDIKVVTAIKKFLKDQFTPKSV